MYQTYVNTGSIGTSMIEEPLCLQCCYMLNAWLGSVLGCMVSFKNGYLTIILFAIKFRIIYHARTFIVGQNITNINMIQNSINPITKSSTYTKKLSPWRTHHKLYLVGVTISIFTGRFFDTMIDVIIDTIDSPLYNPLFFFQLLVTSLLQ